MEYKLKEGNVVNNAIEYTYNSLNRLTSMENNDKATAIVHTYDPNGNLTEKATDKGLVTEYVYNKAGFHNFNEKYEERYSER